jgi:hypothetical protein
MKLKKHVEIVETNVEAHARARTGGVGIKEI